MLLQLVQGADATAVRSTIICLVGPGDQKGSFSQPGIGSTDLIVLGTKGHGPGPLAFRRLASILRDLKPDIIQTWDYASTLIGTIAQRLTGASGPSLVWSLQTMPPTHGFSQRFLPSLLALFAEWAEAIVVRSSQIMRAHAPFGYHSRNWQRISYSPLLIDQDAIKLARDRLRTIAALPASARILMQVMDENWQADFARYLGAIKALVRTEPDLNYLVLCPINLRESDEARVILRGFEPLPHIQLLDIDKVDRQLALGADVLISPGGAGGALSNLTVTAIANAIPCLSDSSGSAEIQDADPRLFMLPDDAAAMAGALRRLIHLSPDQRADLCQRQVQSASAQYRAENSLARYGLMCRQLALRRQTRIEALAQKARALPRLSFMERQVNRLAETLGMRGGLPVRSLAATVLLVAIMTAIGRSATFVREVMVAAAFGTGPELEAYFLALAIPTFLTVSATAAIPAAYARISGAASPSEVPYVLGRMTLLMGLVAIGVTIVLSVTAPFYMSVIGRGLPPETRAVATALVPWVCAIIPSQLWIALWTVALNIRGRFAWPALLSALTPFGVVMALVLAGGMANAQTLAYGTAAGALVETLVIAAMAMLVGVRFRFFKADIGTSLGRIGRETATVVLGTLILGSIPLADQVISAQVGPGSVGAFFLGSKIVASITGISAIALSQAVIPRISQLATSGDRLALLALARNTIVIVVAVGLVASGLVSAFSAGIVDFVFARGRFGVAETAAVSAAQAAYAWHIAPFLAWIVISRILVTLGASRSVLWLSAMAALVNLALDLAVVDQFGVPGVALTTAITYGLVMGFGLFSLRRTIGAGD